MDILDTLISILLIAILFMIAILFGANVLRRVLKIARKSQKDFKKLNASSSKPKIIYKNTKKKKKAKKK